MTTTDARFSGSVAAMYEQHLVPALFTVYADDLVSRLADVSAGTILETAAGTGVVTRALTRLLPSSVRIVATDLNEAMLSRARGLAGERVTFQQADAQRLSFADGEFVAVVSQFGMMFLPDKVAGYREARRVLGAGGRFLFNVWGALDANPASKVVSDAVASRFPNDPPRFIPRTPFGYHDEAVIRGALLEAGFSRVEIEVVDRTAPASARQIAAGLCQGCPLRMEIEARGGDLDAVTNHAAAALEAHFGAPTFDNPMRALVVTARG